eukprot:TRINITY_DN6012_c0_g1_i2.p1 TRINITY_DN6012_c0_g1~~TRINITY_DN6012_c0_g1_i2.p1  ORF type:complete len:806 (-),score=266.81 TRINITY_DN6012_c0_g1_i2:540-2957(-)
MGWFRSEEMEYISCIFQEDVAHNVVDDLGNLGVVQFNDLNPELVAFERRYVDQIRKTDEMERKLRYFDAELEKYHVKVVNSGDVTAFLDWVSRHRHEHATSLLQDLNATLDEHERRVRELKRYHESLRQAYNEKLEFKQVMQSARAMFVMDSELHTSAIDDDRPLLEGDIESGPVSDNIGFNYICGTVLKEDQAAFERMVFRMTFGNCYVRFAEVEEMIVDPQTNKQVSKAVFVLFYQSRVVEGKLKKICDAFNAHRYEVPNFDDDKAVNSVMMSTNSQLSDSGRVLAQHKAAMIESLTEIAKYQQNWRWVVKKEKSIYHTMNKFRADVPGVLQAKGWIVKSAHDEVVRAVKNAHKQAGGNEEGLPSMFTVVPQPWPKPPTHFTLNKFTAVFQGVVETYGVARYREINPAYFTTVTFPFLFAVMYGDMCHAALLGLAGLCLILWEKKLMKIKLNEIVEMAFEGRYMILLMGIFGVYCGFMYNDFMALPLNLFGSKWYKPTDEATEYERIGTQVYPAGVDPQWHAASNDLDYMNSLKMKLSVIFGVTQMGVGSLLRAGNAINNKSMVDLLFEAIPQFCLLMSLFGYMVFTIIYKWTVDWSATLDQPPSLINTLLNVVLKLGGVEDSLYDRANDGKLQESIQFICLMVFVLAIPIMLIPKPVIEHIKAKGHSHEHVEGEEEESHTLGERLIHQGIETIEFVFGSISNTASYLRLWALSLAHSELALVFWSKFMATTINMKNPVAIVFGFACFFSSTFAVLLIMDVLECFLHALRLHWVEFQNKFYMGDGYAFNSFSFKTILSAEDSP